MKTAQQGSRPFNTYPRTDSDGGRSPTGQVRLLWRHLCFIGQISYFYVTTSF